MTNMRRFYCAVSVFTTTVNAKSLILRGSDFAPTESMEVGHQLSTARTQRGLTLDDVSRTTKIPVSILDAIERNDSARLPQGFFTRAFVRAYAQEVGVNADDLLDNSELQAVPLDTRHGHVPLDEPSNSKSLFAGIAIGVMCTMFYSGYASQAAAPVVPQVAVATAATGVESAALTPPPCVLATPAEAPVQSAQRPAPAVRPAHVETPAQSIPVTHIVSGDQAESSATTVESSPTLSDAILPSSDPAPASVEQF